MKIGFVVNRPETERAGYTTTHLALAARRRGHETWHIGIADFALAQDDRLMAGAVSPEPSATEPEAFSAALAKTEAEALEIGTLDVLLLRNDPAVDTAHRPWACLAGLDFGRIAQADGVLVLNDPVGLSRAENKLYLQQFDAEVRPEAIVSRHTDEILDFVRSRDLPSVIKPLSGSGGHDVFVLDPDDKRNVHQIIEAVTEDGYALVQAFVEGASAGDIRLFMVEGEILRAGGQPALVRRQSSGGDLRHNLTAGGKATRTDLTPEIETLADAIGPKLAADGIFLAGVDIVGDKILEINVFSPGALVGCSKLHQVSFADEVIARLEARHAREATPIPGL